MPLAPLAFEALAEIAIAVVNSPNLDSAVELLVSQLSNLFGTHVTLFEKRGQHWHAIAGTPRTFDTRDSALSLTGPDGPPLVLVLDGDWTADQNTLKVFALLVSMGLDSLRQRGERHAANRRVVAAYAMARRLSRLGSVEQVAQNVVDQVAALMEADRVSLAVYDRNEQALSIAATSGYPLSDVKDVRIPAGAWLIGHVYAHARPVVVSDARLFPGMRHERYRSHSFAAVPLLAGGETVGVLSVTEKRDGDRFDQEDEIVLRGIGVIAALALVAARSTTEAATLAHAATIDSVTNLLNRPYLDNRLREEVARSKREGTTLSLLIGDIDDFKRINDAFGHQAGDQVLRVVGGIIRSAVRVFDVCARYGGDEFAILMPNCDRDSAIACAERIRLRVAQHDGRQHGLGLPTVTMSIGVAVIREEEDAAALVSRADQHLYQAKADGKNLVRSESIGQQGPVRVESRTYVLIADADEDRAALCAGIARGFGIRVSLARSSHQAISLIEQADPAVLIVDLSLPPAGGFGVVEALRGDRRPEIIAWSASREIAEYAASRPAWPSARVLSGHAPASTIRAALEKVLRRHDEAIAARGTAAPLPEQADKIMKALAEKAQHLCDTAGVAVYLKAVGDTGFRTFLNWTSGESMPHLPYAVPRAVDRVIETGRTIPDTRGHESSNDVPRDAIDDLTRGLAAVPIVFDDEVIGAICIFDVKPLALDDRNVAALAALGRNAFSNALVTTSSSAEPVNVTQFRDRETDRRQAGTAALVSARPAEWPPAILERTGGEFAVARELARARREGRQLSVVLFDVSPSAAGDATAQHVPDEHINALSDTLLRTIRQSDLPIRWNVSELLVVLPGLAGNQARSVAERVRAALQAGVGHRLSVSGGVAELENEERFADVVERARQKVAMAVGRGHNRVL
jgi:diguanylate cyclase (GGDEF)-like protein